MSIRTDSAAIAVALLLNAGVPAASAGPEAQPGTLAFTPERPTAGEHIKVSYRPAAILAGEGALRLRARIRTAAQGTYDTGMGSREVARLDVGADGVARGTFRLPQEAVYAAFAVEIPDASRTDSREGRFWELLVHDDHGRPLLEALEQRFNDYMGRDMGEVLETARTMSRIHPDAPAAWTALRAAEGWAGTVDNEDARAAHHQARLVELDRTLRDTPGLPASDVGSMYQYARGLGSEEIATRWRERMVAEHPADFFAVQERLGELFREHGDDREAFLAALEPLWQSAADQRARVPVGHLGFQFALRSRNSEAILRWVDRYIVTEPASATWALTTLAGFDATRDEGIRRLGVAISEVARAADSGRALGQTAAEYRASVEMQIAELRAGLGRALLAAGRADEAIVQIEKATGTSWNAAWLRSLAEARLAAGDNAGAVPAFAAVAADPDTDESTAEALRDAAGVPGDAWDAEVTRARQTMLEQTLAAARQEEIGSPSARLRGGGVAKLTDLLGPEATVVVFWGRRCAYSIAAMPRIAAIAAQLAATDVPLLAVTRDSPDAAEEYLEEGGFDLNILFDHEGALGQAFNVWGTPEYYVLDGAGRLRFVSSLDALLRHTLALRESL